MEEKGQASEAEAAKIIHKLLLGLNHVHSVGIIHRDLKPENIMVANNGEPKIIDFGLSKDTVNQPSDTFMVGSKIFMAPEILEGLPHTVACDMWSLGIIIFMLLSGQYPFDLRNIDQEILETPVLFLGPAWENISREAKSFITLLLCKDPYDRLTAADSLEHPWLKKRFEAEGSAPS